LKKIIIFFKPYFVILLDLNLRVWTNDAVYDECSDISEELIARVTELDGAVRKLILRC